jgi:putative phage-type endonuclease
MIQLEKSEAWHEERRKGIGASDAPIVMGVGLRTRFRLWQEKVGLAPPPAANNAMRAGNLLEDLVADVFASDHPELTIRRKTRAVWHKDLPLFAHLDRDGKDTESHRFLLEIKTAAVVGEWGESGTDEIPYYYVPQIQHALLVTGYDYAWVAVFILDTREFRYYIVPRDNGYIDNMLEPLTNFWKLVEQNIPPNPSNAEETIERFPTPAGTIEATPEILEALKLLVDARARKSQANKDEDAAKDIIAPFMGSAEVLNYDGKAIATFKEKRSKRFNQSTFKDARPALFEEFVDETSTREMRAVK